ncbi:MAG TPA: M14 family zinc carboxypeptidase, partial [Chloroflexia bacterium]|nr:M14 family zinc carboxypeptidase [Chloroflexia bacterium]
MASRASLCSLLLFSLLLLGITASASSQATVTIAASDSQSPLWDPACYSTYPQLETSLQDTAAQYPQIATLLDAGLSWEGTRHLWALKLGSARLPGPKPTLLLLGGQHPRDIATSQILLRYISYLTQTYGTDPDTTWLLDNRTILILPEANPDGYYQVYAQGLNQYKNRDNTACTGSVNRGVDLNRNYPYHWNTVGTSSLPCDLSYPGPSALSEPESAGILSLLTANNTNLLLNLQAPGPRILYPYGYTPTPPADAPALFALGWAIARLNGTPFANVQTHNALAPISGIIDDTA